MTRDSQRQDTASPDAASDAADAQGRRRSAPSGESTARPGHAPGGGELDTIPDDQAHKVVPDDPRQTEVRDPAGKPWPGEHDAPDDSGERPRPL
ncbi:hypothetical protein K6W26_01195 [Burkholderia sp. AU42008]|uniref:hypothetical protein n=1 Tax=unclassified Burkholderia TaxID=2613784 RepID=UPI000B7A899E|nr:MULTISPECIES: hypothetical protein [unclassified Burkholderia]MBR8236127.1 hypothetical protein [Burkholderia sp. AU32357]MBY4871689.1 hypothetical protein [Burkholderia sp. AU42008]OXI37785.1 hypothetical protein CFB49_32650 [Burkholderia sp. AU17457]